MIEAIGKRIVRGYRFVHPIMIAVLIATILVLITFLSNFTLTATVFSEEGGGGEAVKSGLFNAGLFLLIAIIGGFLIFLLFKYRKKNILQYVFGTALSVSGGFILFFFAMILIDDITHYSTGLLVNSTFWGGRTSDPFFLMFHTANLEFPLFIVSITMGILMTHIVLSGKYKGDQKNRFLLLLSGLMGAFLAVILPTWTVMFMLIGLSFYDIYSVKHGPIKSIIEMTEEDYDRRMKALQKRRRRNRIVLDVLRRHRFLCPSCSSHRLFISRGDAVRCTDCGQRSIVPGVTGLIVAVLRRLEGYDGTRISRPGPVMKVTKGSRVRGRRTTSERSVVSDERAESAVLPLCSLKWFRGRKGRRGRKGLDAEHLMKSMTYNTPHWDLGIGDLVFYSMLAGHSFQYGAGYYNDVGILAPFLMLALSMTGILVGFVITIRLLEKNKILPGLPMSMFIGIFGFLIGAVFLWLW